MAEFQEVMRQWVRVRKATKCRGEENNMLSVYPLEAYDNTLIANIEERVMSWAAEHPEPVYPTWGEWFVSRGMLPDKWDEVTSAYIVVKNYVGCLPNGCIPNLMHSPIPADIAHKLGLEPEK